MSRLKILFILYCIVFAIHITAMNRCMITWPDKSISSYDDISIHWVARTNERESALDLKSVKDQLNNNGLLSTLLYTDYAEKDLIVIGFFSDDLCVHLFKQKHVFYDFFNNSIQEELLQRTSKDKVGYLICTKGLGPIQKSSIFAHKFIFSMVILGAISFVIGAYLRSK